MRRLLIFLCMLTSGFLSAQGFTYPIINSLGKEVKDFIPQEWNLVDTTSGDLNKDGFSDIALVIENRNVKFIHTESFI